MNVDPVHSPARSMGPHSVEQLTATSSDSAQVEFQQRLEQLLSRNTSGPESETNSDPVRGGPQEKDELKTAFSDFVGQTLFGQLIASMRSTQQEPAYFHGGQAERIFQNQLDQELTQSISKASADTVAGPMYELFRLRRSP